MNNTIHWISIPGFSLYEASSEGAVRNVKTGKLSSVNTGSHGYLMVNLKDDSGKWCARLLHAVIATAFHGARPLDMDCCHNDGDRVNNRASNLRWDTRKANLNDQKRHGTFAWHGEKKLLASHIPTITSMAEAGRKHSEIAAQFGVSRAAISAVLNGKSWQSITGRSESSNRRYHRGEKMRGILNDAKVQAIITKLDAGVPQKNIAVEFGVKPQTVSNINVGKTWGWLTGRGAS